MSDPIARLKSQLKAATPPADADARAQTLARAQENFVRHQETAHQARPNTDGTPMLGRLGKGVRSMFASFSTRGAMVATTALIAVGVVAILPMTKGPGLPGLVKTEAPALQGTTASSAGTTTVPPAPAKPKADAETRLSTSDAATSQMAAPTAAPNAARKMAPASQAPSIVIEAAPEIAGDLSVLSEPRLESDFYPTPDVPQVLNQGTESYSNAPESPLKITADQPVSTFSIDTDTASYSIVRSSLEFGQLPPPEAVRVEEMVNYFPYDYPAPTAGGAPFRPSVSVTQTPWNPDTKLVHIALQGVMPAVQDRPPLDLVFLIDTSGSMQDANKLGLLKTSFAMMLSRLSPQDKVAIVTYAGSAGQVLAPTPASDRETILGALNRLEAGGSTNGQEGLQQAYATAAQMAAQEGGDGRIGRVILATDGDFNVGLSGAEALKSYIADKRDSGTYLSVLGFGRGNLDDAVMQSLAQNGNGQAAYIDTASEAQKVLFDQLTGALFPIANDVKIQVEFNPAQIAEYRLIGYETRALRRQDFNNDKIDAGEIGAGHSVTAIYEVTPTGSAAQLSDPLRYGDQTANQSDELGYLRLRYKEPGQSQSKLIETPIKMAETQLSDDARFGIAIAGFGQLLRHSEYLGSWSIGDAITLATGARGADEFGYRQEAIGLMRIAQSLEGEK